MHTTHRSYAETAGDFHRLCRFISTNAAYLRAGSTWSLGRIVDWKYGLYENKQAIAGFCDHNAQLWFDGFDDLAGFAISENGDAGFAIVTAPGYRFLFDEILGWLLDAWRGRGARLSTEVTEHQAVEIAILECCGFRRSATFAARRFDLASAPIRQSPLEPGFVIVDMAEHPDYAEQRRMRADGFGGITTLSDEQVKHQLEFYNYVHQGPIYHPHCDLCVMAADGRFVAGCEALIDARSLEADIERVCTRAAFRQRGFARAVIGTCLARLRDMGLRHAYITGYSPEALALYGSLGHAGQTTAFIYELQV